MNRNVLIRALNRQRCYCPACEEPLILRHADFHHFDHDADGTSSEWLHGMAMHFPCHMVSHKKS